MKARTKVESSTAFPKVFAASVKLDCAKGSISAAVPSMTGVMTKGPSGLTRLEAMRARKPMADPSDEVARWLIVRSSEDMLSKWKPMIPMKRPSPKKQNKTVTVWSNLVAFD